MSAPVSGWPNGPTQFEQRHGNAMMRVVTAVFAIPLVVGAIWLGGWALYAFVVLISLGALMEFYWLAEKKGANPNKVIGVAAAVVLPLLWMLGQGMADPAFYKDYEGYAVLQLMPMVQFGLLAAGVILAGAITFMWEIFRTRGSALLNATATVAGIVYVPLLLSCLIGLRGVSSNETAGIYNVLMVMVTIWICDSAAYYCGRAFGRHKLFERVSPKKTWEGAIGGAVFAVLTLIGVRAWLLPGLSLVDAIVIGLIVGVCGQIGDLAESHLKRDAGVKDSSQLIPGHGGLLDRFDSLIVVAPLVYVYLTFFGH